MQISPVAMPLPRTRPKRSASQSQAPVPTSPLDRLPSLSEAGLKTGEHVPVSHFREMRGAWIASVWNINFPSSPGSSPETQKAELRRQLDRLQECGFNAVFFQVRPEGDALFSSQLEPWSSSLTGRQGQDPGYDPLQALIEEAQERNLEVHAWLNPFRAQAASPNLAPPHLATTHPDLVHPYGPYLWMDPGAKEVQQRLVDVCQDLVERYDLDGIHFDDYFYPYPDGKSFPDDASWQEYRRGGGTMSRADWRRDNVNRTIQAVDEAVESKADHVRFGISPFGIPAPEKPEGIRGFDQYNGLYADPQKWIDEGWVDYLAPQLYWPTTRRGQEYEPLVRWWNEHAPEGRAIFAGNNLAALGSSSQWDEAEYRKQVQLSRQHASSGGAGNLWWHIGPLLNDKRGITSLFRDELYRKPALTPPLPEAPTDEVSPPQVRLLGGGQVNLTATDDSPLRGWTLYHRTSEQQWELEKILPSQQRSLQLTEGTWAIAAATRHGKESLGTVVQVPPEAR